MSCIGFAVRVDIIRCLLFCFSYDHRVVRIRLFFLIVVSVFIVVLVVRIDRVVRVVLGVVFGVGRRAFARPSPLDGLLNRRYVRVFGIDDKHRIVVGEAPAFL